MPYYDPKRLGLMVSRQSGDEALVFCPYHDDKHPSASFNVRSGLFFCFTCATSKFVTQLASDLGGEVTDILMESGEWRAPEVGEEYDAWSRFLGFPLAIDNDYLASRLVTNHQVKSHGIMDYSGNGVIFPMGDGSSPSGAIIRQLNRDPKYLIVGKRQPVWPMDVVRGIGGTDKVFIVEGVFGVLRAEKFGRVAVATLGVGGVDRALKLLNSNPGLFRGRTWAIMDTDLPGKVAAAKFILAGYPVVHLHKRDPDEWSQTTWDGLFSRFEEVTTDRISDLIRSVKKSDIDKFYKSLPRLRKRV